LSPVTRNSARVVFRADVVDGLVNHLLEIVRGNVLESFADLPDGLVKDTPADSFLFVI